MTTPNLAVSSQAVKRRRTDSPYVAGWLEAHDVPVAVVPNPDDPSEFYFTYPAEAVDLVQQYEAGGTIEARRFAEAVRSCNARLGRKRAVRA